MSLIKIDVNSGSIVSESAAKSPSYKIARVGGATTLVIPSEKKADVARLVSILNVAKKAAIAGIASSIKSATAMTKSRQIKDTERKHALKATGAAERKSSAASIKIAKANLKVANSTAKKLGLGGLNLPLSSTDIKTGVGSSNALKAIRAIKVNEFGVTGKRGTFKPKFIKLDAFENLGKKASSTKAASEKAPIKIRKGAVTGAHTPARARAVKMEPGALSAKVDKRMPKALDEVGIHFDQNKKSGAVTYNTEGDEGKPITKKNIVMAELRMHLEDRKIPVQQNKDGFEIPGVIRFIQSDTGVKFKRLDK